MVPNRRQNLKPADDIEPTDVKRPSNDGNLTACPAYSTTFLQARTREMSEIMSSFPDKFSDKLPANCRILDRRRRYEARHRALGLCKYCHNQARAGLLACVSCGDKHKIWNNSYNPEYVKRMAESNRCVKCSCPLDPDADAGYRCCLNCREGS